MYSFRGLLKIKGLRFHQHRELQVLPYFSSKFTVLERKFKVRLHPAEAHRYHSAGNDSQARSFMRLLQEHPVAAIPSDPGKYCRISKISGVSTYLPIAPRSDGALSGAGFSMMMVLISYTPSGYFYAADYSIVFYLLPRTFSTTTTGHPYEKRIDHLAGAGGKTLVRYGDRIAQELPQTADHYNAFLHREWHLRGLVVLSAE